MLCSSALFSPFQKGDPVQKTRKPISQNKKGVRTKTCVPCPICNMPVSNISSAYLTRHYRFHHKNEKIPVKQSESRKLKVKYIPFCFNCKKIIKSNNTTLIFSSRIFRHHQIFGVAL